jgi:hypothetical protein
VRAPNGAITTVDVPGAGTGPLQGTQALAITPAGTITGFYTDASSVNHGFVQDKHGGFTTFDAPGAGTGPNQGTTAFTSNPAGVIVGSFLDASNAYHGFLVEGE